MRTLNLLGLLALSLGVNVGAAVDTSKGPLVVLYVEQWAVWGRDYHPSDLDKAVIQRQMPYRDLHVLYSFLTPTEADCVLRTPDASADFYKVDADASYNVNNLWADKPGPQGALGGFLQLKARYPKVSFLPSIGGWSMSYAFHKCTDSTNREALMKSMEAVITVFNFDGIDIDWEYPACAEACGCQNEATCPTTSNKSAPGDWDQYLEFLILLRKRLDDLGTKMGKRLFLTMAVGMNIHLLRGDTSQYTTPTPINKLCGIMDNLNLMTYDYFGTWTPKTGPLAPMYDNPNVPDDDDMNIDQSITEVLKNCPFPEKLNMGLATYAKAWQSVPKTGTPPGLWQTSTKTTGWQAMNTLGEDGGTTGTLPWFELSSKWMSKCKRTWDNYSMTPTAFCATSPNNGETDLFISFEDGESWRYKMKYAKAKGMGGAIIWAASDTGNMRRTPTDMAKDLWSGLFQGWYGDDTISVKTVNQLPNYKFSPYTWPYPMSESTGACPIGAWAKNDQSSWGPSPCDMTVDYSETVKVTPDTSNIGDGGAGSGDTDTSSGGTGWNGDSDDTPVGPTPTEIPAPPSPPDPVDPGNVTPSDASSTDPAGTGTGTGKADGAVEKFATAAALTVAVCALTL